MIVIGDSLQVMAAMKPDSIDAIVTDPPYGLGFMNAKWDTFDLSRVEKQREINRRKESVRTSQKWPDRVGTSQGGGVPIKYDESRGGNERFMWWCEAWAAEAFHVLKPGGHLIAFASSRTFHRAWCGIEDAGFEIRDTLSWIFGSGFPKSLDVAKAIDRQMGVKSEVEPVESTTGEVYGEGINVNFAERSKWEPQTDEARAWEGWGTALKPGWEPIILARKPFRGTVAGNVLEHGTGGLNIDACRIGLTKDVPASPARERENIAKGREGDRRDNTSGFDPSVGRWPANVIVQHHPDCELIGRKRVRSGTAIMENGGGGIMTGIRPERRDRASEFKMTQGSSSGYAEADGLETVEAWACHEGCPVRQLDEQSGVSTSTGGRAAQVGMQGFRDEEKGILPEIPGYGDVGGASRFFYVPKASTAERNAWGRIKGVEPQRRTDGRASDIDNPRLRTSARVNRHPTVKPLELMAQLVRLVTPPGGLVLDPFAGSGTTLVAARREGFRAMGIERDPESARIAHERIKAQWEVKLF